MSVTTSKGAQEVVEALQNVLEKRNGLMYKLSGYVIISKQHNHQISKFAFISIVSHYSFVAIKPHFCCLHASHSHCMIGKHGAIKKYNFFLHFIQVLPFVVKPWTIVEKLY